MDKMNLEHFFFEPRTFCIRKLKNTQTPIELCPKDTKASLKDLPLAKEGTP